uniref:Glycosylphosphatidylinositol anchor attachment 1 protein n=1 Tax=Branchiostoma floridae TaxID=7739 RepID=C3XUF8_BRAFL|eukprot:XP_002612523.1 hypothetical protein BRAFLDRAFT_120979 [Branchiostoma floridae]
MGLLSDPKSRERFSRIAAKYNSPLCFIAYVVGVVWFLALAYKPFNHKTYFSENALLPGLVEGKFRSDNIATRISQAMRDIKNVSRDGPMPVAWVVNQFQGLGLDTYTQEYIQTIPVPSASKSKEQGKDMFVTLNGTNVYAILRAPRTASTEAIVLSAPYKHYITMDHNNHAFGLMVALATHFRKSSYWSKDIIFLLVDYDEIGMEAWLQEYHYTKSPLLKSSPLHGRSGSIQAAINLELHTEQVSHFNVKLEGLNGLLPNLDLVNLVVQLCGRERVTVKLHQQYSDGDVWSLVPVVACCQVAGFIASISPMVMTGVGHLFGTKPYQALITGATGMFFASLFMPKCITRTRLACTVNTLRLWKCAALVLQAIILAATAAANFSLGMLLAFTMVPVCAMVRPGKLRFLQAVVMLLVSPFGLLTIYTGLYLYLTVTEYHGIFPSAIHLCTVVYYNILSGVVHGYVLGTWQYTLLALAVFPNWLFFWCIVFKKRDVPVIENKEHEKLS